MFKISNYLEQSNGGEKQYLFQEIAELIEDEESEVKLNAIKQYVKHIWRLYPDSVTMGSQNVAIVNKLFQTGNDVMCPRDIKDYILTSTNKMLIKTSCHDPEILNHLSSLLISALATDSGKEAVGKSIAATALVYCKANTFYKSFYQPVY